MVWVHLQTGICVFVDRHSGKAAIANNCSPLVPIRWNLRVARGDRFRFEWYQYQRIICVGWTCKHLHVGVMVYNILIYNYNWPSLGHQCKFGFCKEYSDCHGQWLSRAQCQIRWTWHRPALKHSAGSYTVKTKDTWSIENWPSTSEHQAANCVSISSNLPINTSTRSCSLFPGYYALS